MKMIHYLKANMLHIAGLLAIVLAMSFTFGPGKTEKRDNPEKVETANTVYYYNSDEMGAGAFADPSHWKTTNANGACGSPQPFRPCQITVPAGSSLSSILSGKSNADVLDISEGYKDEP